MIFDRNKNKEVLVLLGGGVMATAIARRIGAGKKILLGMPNAEKLEKDADDLRRSGYDVVTKTVNALDKDSIQAFAAYAASLGEVKYFLDSAGASPNQASPEHIIQLDLVGTAWALDAFGPVMARGGAGLVISSQAGHMMPMSLETEQQLATVPSDELTELDIVKHTAMERSGNAYMVAKRCNHLRVRTAAATTWGDGGARINTISPGIIVTPLAYDPEIEYVQIIANYADFHQDGLEIKNSYDVIVKHNRQVIVMEPVKGGQLANVGDEAKALFDAFDSSASPASFAVRFAASLPNVHVVLSGMTTMEQMEDNTSYMKEFVPLGEEEYKLLDQVNEVFDKRKVILADSDNPAIHRLFAIYNNRKMFPSRDGWQNILYGCITGRSGTPSALAAKEHDPAIKEGLKLVADEF